jgi:TP901 family phage tail tape measure protein
MSSKNLQVTVALEGADKLSPKIKNALVMIKDVESKTAAARNKLRELAINENQFKGLDAAKEKLARLRTNVDTARRGAEELQKAMAIGQATEKEVKQAVSALNKLEREYGDATQKALASRKALNDKGFGGSGGRNALTSQIQAAQVELAQAEKMDKIRARNSALESRGASYAMAGVGMTAAGTSILGGLGSTVAAYKQAEVAATGLKTAMMDSGGKVSAQFGAINDLATRLGNKLPGTTADFQDMMTMLVRQGMSAETILSGTGEAAAYLGVQLKLAPAAAAEFAAKMQDAIRAPASEMMGVMDVIQRTFYAGVDPTNMLAAFSKAGVAMDILKVKGEQGARTIAPLLAMADQSGLVGESAGNALRKVMQLSMDTEKTKEYGLNFTNNKGEHAGLQAMFQELQKLKNLTTEKRLETIKDIFGNDAETIQMLTIMIEKGQAGYDEMTQKLAAQADLKARVDESLNTLAAVQEAAEGTFTNMLAAWGETLAPILKKVAAWLGSVSEGIMKWTKENPNAARVLGILAAILGVVLVVGGGVALAIAAMIAPFAMLSMAAGALSMSLTPILLAILGVIAVVALVIAAFVYWGDITAWLQQKWDGFKNWLFGLWNGIVQQATGLWQRIKSAWAGFSFVDVGLNLMRGLANGIMNAGSFVINAALGVARKVVGAVKGALGIQSPSRVFAEVGGFTALGMAQGIMGRTPDVVSSVQRMVNGVKRAGATTITAGMMAGGGFGGGLAQAGQAPNAAQGAAPQITININSANQAPEAIAQAVQAQLEKYFREKRRSGGAHFFDKD